MCLGARAVLALVRTVDVRSDEILYGVVLQTGAGVELPPKLVKCLRDTRCPFRCMFHGLRGYGGGSVGPARDLDGDGDGDGDSGLRVLLDSRTWHPGKTDLLPEAKRLKCLANRTRDTFPPGGLRAVDPEWYDAIANAPRTSAPSTPAPEAPTPSKPTPCTPQKRPCSEAPSATPRPTKRRQTKACKCGSFGHKTTNHRDCRLHRRHRKPDSGGAGSSAPPKPLPLNFL